MMGRTPTSQGRLADRKHRRDRSDVLGGFDQTADANFFWLASFDVPFQFWSEHCGHFVTPKV